MSCATFSVNGDGVPSLIFVLPIASIAESKSLLHFHYLDSEMKEILLPLLNRSFCNWLEIFNYLESNPTWHNFSELAIHFGCSRNATIKRCLCLKLGDFPIELTSELVRYLAPTDK